jgi:hypothetical protein
MQFLKYENIFNEIRFIDRKVSGQKEPKLVGSLQFPTKSFSVERFSG